jgi:inhibitor of cysteine peptidase
MVTSIVAVATIGTLAIGCGSDDDSGGGGDDGKVFTSSPVDVSVDDTFVIELEANPSTGYTWELSGPLDEAIVVSLGSDHEAGDGDAVGAPGTQELSFRAVGEGTTTIALQYVRPWETDVAPSETQDFTVNVSS